VNGCKYNSFISAMTVFKLMPNACVLGDYVEKFDFSVE
jgi:hypothetical protein